MNAPTNRSTRCSLEVPLSFKTSDGMITGQTIDVSESGILVRLDSPVELWLVGELSLTAGEYYIQIEARVARTFGDGCGLSFLIENDMDRLSIGILYDYAKSLTPGAAISHSNA